MTELEPRNKGENSHLLGLRCRWDNILDWKQNIASTHLLVKKINECLLIGNGFNSNDQRAELFIESKDKVHDLSWCNLVSSSKRHVPSFLIINVNNNHASEVSRVRLRDRRINKDKGINSRR